MTISEQKTFLRAYQGASPLDAACGGHWKAVLEDCRPQVTAESLPFGNARGIYEILTITDRGRALKARCIRTDSDGKHPLVLLYHDLNRAVRGWHHMTRFLALGYGVVALEAAPFREDWRKDPAAANFRQRYRDALTVGKAAIALPWVDSTRVVTFGEGLGGGLAILTAALLPCAPRCAALHPMPADLSGLGLESMEELDLKNLAPLCKSPLLLGTCLMDTYSPPKGQAAIYNNLQCEKQWKIYPKYAHERVNFFENELVRFLVGTDEI